MAVAPLQIHRTQALVIDVMRQPCTRKDSQNIGVHLCVHDYRTQFIHGMSNWKMTTMIIMAAEIATLSTARQKFVPVVCANKQNGKMQFHKNCHSNDEDKRLHLCTLLRRQICKAFIRKLK